MVLSGDPEAGTIVVEFEPTPGLQKTASAPDEIAVRSAFAVARAMTTIQEMADKVVAAARQATEPPDELQVEFGIKLDAVAGALIAKAGASASLNVTLTWRRSDGA